MLAATGASDAAFVFGPRNSSRCAHGGECALTFMSAQLIAPAPFAAGLRRVGSSSVRFPNKFGSHGSSGARQLEARS